ncbi:MAG: MoaD/ThiS family protein [Armatimonadetes bacterium]|nr:MoaD/ThiS family protein [Armatimonadota bacterium]
MAIVRIPTPLRQYADGARTDSVGGRTLGEALEELTRHWPGLRPRVFDGSGQVHPFVNLFVDGEDVRLGRGLLTPLRADSEIAMIPAMAGGSP